MMSRRRATAGAIVLVLAAGLLVAPWLRPWWRERALRRAPRPLSVLLVTLDTTRADRLGCYGRAGDVTPQLDALARRGVLFRQAYSHVPLTCPAHTSLLTGRLPTRHGVRDNGGYVLAPDVPTLAERFAAAGYRTGAFVSAFVLDHRFGLARGFQTYHDRVPAPGAADHGDPSQRSVRAEETVGRALAWLAQEPTRPFFLWVHLFDPHQPYEPPEPFASRFRDDPYQGEIAYMDAQAGRLFEAAGTRGALIAAMGDHGEGLGDHQEVTHSYFIYSNTQRVPWLISLPGYLPTGSAVDGIVRGVDLAPTLLDVAGLAPLPEIDGVSLTSLITGSRKGDSGAAYLESYHPRFWWGAQELLGLRSGRWLFIEAPRPELYDVTTDPLERNNLAASQPLELDTLRAQLRGLNAGGVLPAASTQMDAETARKLQALGYLGAGPAVAAVRLPDPKDNGPLLDLVTRGHDLLLNGHPAQALLAFEQALALNPRAASVRGRIAETLLQLGRHEDAFQAYAQLATERPGEEAFLGLSTAREAQGRVPEALELARAGLRSLPDSLRLHGQEAHLLLSSGDATGAEAAARQTLVLFPGDAVTRSVLGAALTQRGQTREAREVWLALAEESPDSVEARVATRPLLAWGDESMERGEFEIARRCYEASLASGASSDAVFLNLALAVRRLGRSNEALSVLERGLAAFPRSPDLHYRTGRMLQDIGRRAEAEASYRRALELAPERRDAAEALARLGSVSSVGP
jgi:choline-sulfatase